MKLYACAISRPSSTFSSDVPAALAISATVGERPSSWPSVLTIFVSSRWSSCSLPGNPDGPALVPEVPLELADDRRRRVGRELDLAVEVEALDRLQQPDRSNLHQILERLASVPETAREKLDETDVLVDESFSETGVGRPRVRRCTRGRVAGPRLGRAWLSHSLAIAHPDVLLLTRETSGSRPMRSARPSRRRSRGSSARTRSARFGPS